MVQKISLGLQEHRAISQGQLSVDSEEVHQVWRVVLRLVWFYGISTIVGYLMPNHLYTCISNIHDLVLLGFMTYQPL